MIFENNPLKQLTLHEQNNFTEKESIFSESINFYGVPAFLMKSLEKIKNNSACEIVKNAISNILEDYSSTIHEYPILNTQNLEQLSFPIYAKTAYSKVLKEQETLQKLLESLESKNIL